MVKFLKSGKVVLVLNGRHAGKKAVIVRSYDDGTKLRPYPHCLIAGIEKYPKKVTRHMSKKKISIRSRVKPFLKLANLSHLMPTRYGVESDLKKTITAKTLLDPSKRKTALRKVKRVFQERYLAGKNRWFFQKLYF